MIFLIDFLTELFAVLFFAIGHRAYRYSLRIQSFLSKSCGDAYNLRHMQPRHSSLPASYEPKLRAALIRRGYSLDEPAKLADAVLRLSSFYLENPSVQTPWHEVWAQAASLVYFFPLNYARSSLVAREVRRFGFFEGLTSAIDDGAGMGSAIHAFNDILTAGDVANLNWTARDISHEALKMLNELTLTAAPVKTKVVDGLQRDELKTDASLIVASYVFTELKDIPREWLSHEALIIIEPSSRDDARRLQAERKTLLEAGFEIWAPCTHHGECPLLIHSDKDWCHDRVHFEAPDWFAKIEKYLPMKNRTLTFTYLAARKRKAPRPSSPARLVGDTLEEKGKSRQALCRSSEKEFLAWFPQRFANKEHIEMSRGSLVSLHGDLEKKSQEARLKTPDQVYEFGVDESISLASTP